MAINLPLFGHTPAANMPGEGIVGGGLMPMSPQAAQMAAPQLGLGTGGIGLKSPGATPAPTNSVPAMMHPVAAPAPKKDSPQIGKTSSTPPPDPGSSQSVQNSGNAAPPQVDAGGAGTQSQSQSGERPVQGQAQEAAVDPITARDKYINDYMVRSIAGAAASNTDKPLGDLLFISGMAAVSGRKEGEAAYDAKLSADQKQALEMAEIQSKIEKNLAEADNAGKGAFGKDVSYLAAMRERYPNMPVWQDALDSLILGKKKGNATTINMSDPNALAEQGLDMMMKIDQPRIEEIQADAATAQKQLRSLSALDVALADAKTGQAAGIGMAVTNFAQYIGVDTDALETMTGSLQSNEAVDAITREMAGYMTSRFPGNLNQEEVKLLTGALPGLLRSKEGNRILAQIMKRDAEIRIAKEDFMYKYFAEQGGYPLLTNPQRIAAGEKGFEQAWRQQEASMANLGDAIKMEMGVISLEQSTGSPFGTFKPENIRKMSPEEAVNLRNSIPVEQREILLGNSELLDAFYQATR